MADASSPAAHEQDPIEADVSFIQFTNVIKLITQDAENFETDSALGDNEYVFNLIEEG
jgi:hypothetical protein